MIHSTRLQMFSPNWWMRHSLIQTSLPVFLKGPQLNGGRVMEIPLSDQSKTYGVYFEGEEVAQSSLTSKLDQRFIVLLHGLGGSSDSVYIRRVTPLLLKAGYRVLHINFRNAGMAAGYAKGIYHSGRSEDLEDIVQWCHKTFDASSISLVGYSLGANILLKYLGENRDYLNIKHAVAICPPFDLEASTYWMRKGVRKIFERYILNDIKKQITSMEQFERYFGSLRKAQSIFDFDEAFTAPLNGFESAREYYQKSSCGPFLSHISVPTCVLVANDDPVVSSQCLEKFSPSQAVKIVKSPRGGHLGFVFYKNREWRSWMDEFVMCSLQQDDCTITNE